MNDNLFVVTTVIFACLWLLTIFAGTQEAEDKKIVQKETVRLQVGKECSFILYKEGKYLFDCNGSPVVAACDDSLIPKCSYEK